MRICIDYKLSTGESQALWEHFDGETLDLPVAGRYTLLNERLEHERRCADGECQSSWLCWASASARTHHWPGEPAHGHPCQDDSLLRERGTAAATCARNERLSPLQSGRHQPAAAVAARETA